MAVMALCDVILVADDPAEDRRVLLEVIEAERIGIDIVCGWPTLWDMESAITDYLLQRETGVPEVQVGLGVVV